MNHVTYSPIAIVGMAGRFPDAPDVRTFWNNLEQEVESLRNFSESELLAAGVDPQLLQNPNYVRRGTILDDADRFDAAFFGFTPKEAAIMDPQHRIFLECAWHALEDAGYAGHHGRNSTGVFAGASLNTYLLRNLLQSRATMDASGAYELMVSNDKDFLATRVSYKLNLKGPSLTIQTACSTSLAAVHTACQALWSRQCNMALAGGVALFFPQKAGYLYTEGMILSPDGHCRPFDHRAAGIRGGMGAGVVVLKRLEDAQRDGDCIRAVILGAAVNNDGSTKMGYTAPSVEGQAEAIRRALEVGGVDPSTIGYIEAHGTGTRVGDPIEIAALRQIFDGSTNRKTPCVIGSLKSNIGHLDVAAGVAGLIKTVLILQHKRIPATLGFEQPNPLLDLANTPFSVNSRLQEWTVLSSPRRAGVSSFGIGGTNVHVVLEEAPPAASSNPRWPAQVLTLSARTADALGTLTAAVAERLADTDISLADACYTLQVGRAPFAHRRVLVCSNLEETRAALAPSRRPALPSKIADSQARSIVFLFSGQGSQYVRMGADLYRVEPTFRKFMDTCAETLIPEIGGDLRDFLYSATADPDRIDETRLAQPALFAIEYSLARMWMSWGIQPQGMIGHSVGEYVAACLAGVFYLEDALKLVAARGRIMQRMPRGSMVMAALPEQELRRHISGGLSIAAVNAPTLCTVSGPHAEVDALQQLLVARGVEVRRLRTSHAFHSSMMEGALEEFLGYFRNVNLSELSLPFISNLTGTWMRPTDAVDPSYWARHLRHTVRFAQGLEELIAPHCTFLEVGPGTALTTFARECMRGIDGCEALASLPHARESGADARFLLQTLAQLWLSGAAINWPRVHEGEGLRRIPLPLYPFERQRYWIEPDSAPQPRQKELDNWFYAPSWRRCAEPLEIRAQETYGPWLVLHDESEASEAMVRTLEARQEEFTVVKPGKLFARLAERTYTINPSRPEDYRLLIDALHGSGSWPRSILYLWGLSNSTMTTARMAFHGMLLLAHAAGNRKLNDPLDWIVVSAGVQNVNGREQFDPIQALKAGGCKVISVEHPKMRCRNIDLSSALETGTYAGSLLLEPGISSGSRAIAYRDGYRWEQDYAPVRLAKDAPRLRDRGVYLITGGSGGIGLTLAAHLAQVSRARLALTSRTQMPERELWPAWLQAHGESNKVSRVIRAAQDIEQQGGEVLFIRADAADRDAMQDAISQIHSRFGPINGVIHAAGIGGAGVQVNSLDALDPVLAPKVAGTLNLHSLLQGESLDFFLLCSSISTLVPTAGAADYTAANAFLDAFAASQSRGGKAAVCSVNWDAWLEVGMATHGAGAKITGNLPGNTGGIKPAGGVEAFRRLVTAGFSQVAVATRDLETWISQAEQAATLSDEETAVETAIGGQTHADHARPVLSSVYAELTTDTQKKIGAIWEELLGIRDIGADDNFFELGGHSLLATRILARVRNIFEVSIPLRIIFDAPTIRLLADHVDTVIWAASGLQDEQHDAEAREEVEL